MLLPSRKLLLLLLLKWTRLWAIGDKDSSSVSSRRGWWGGVEATEECGLFVVAEAIAPDWNRRRGSDGDDVVD